MLGSFLVKMLAIAWLWPRVKAGLAASFIVIVEAAARQTVLHLLLGVVRSISVLIAI